MCSHSRIIRWRSSSTILQWLDAATLDLLEDLLTRSNLQHFLLIGAYRDNEVSPPIRCCGSSRPLKNAGGNIAEITLAPLGREHLEQLITDALHCEPERAAPLAQLVHEKTGGNPFFAIQFLSSLAEEGMLTFDYDAACWSWDHDRIRAKGYTDNVVDLMVGKLTRLPADTQKALQFLACLGNAAETATLSIVLGFRRRWLTRLCGRRSIRNWSSAWRVPTGSPTIAFRKPPIR